MNVINSFLYRTCEWIMRLAFVNFLWIFFSLIGGIVLGFFPATVAMFTIVRKWIMGRADLPILKTYWQTYKSEWLKSNLFGGILIVMGLLIYLEIFIIQHADEKMLQWSKYPVFLLVIMYVFFLLYSIPSYVHYNVNLFQIMKNAFLIMVINPLNNIVIVLSLVFIYLCLNILPPLAFFFGGSGTSFIIMWTCYQSFLNIQRKQKQLLNS